MLRWPPPVWQHLDWLRGSPRGLQLVEWLEDPLKYVAVLGRDGYRGAVLALLQAAHWRDLAAAGLASDSGQPHYAYRVGSQFSVLVTDSPDAAHRAILWSEPDWPGTCLWVDGAEVALGAETPSPYCAKAGRWADARFFAVAVQGPMDHPAQAFPIGADLGAVMGLLVVDAAQGRHHVLQPSANQAWSDPWLEVRDGSWRIYPDRDAMERGDAPDRVIPVSGP
ncbi:hypothetical protein [Ideonella sp. BN130291]|uniref:hypothetical protein n=1 Tax=Ideonella sp. BN130291 TaxID=3112940 RepID=UPI002E25298C|nr:hypothetical protein [Ideonella sp. BN130291]